MPGSSASAGPKRSPTETSPAVDPLGTLLLGVVAFGLLVVPVLLIVGVLLWLSKRHLEGRRSRLDGVLAGVARGSVMRSHLEAGTPHPDEIAVPTPGVPRRRRRRPGPHRRDHGEDR